MHENFQGFFEQLPNQRRTVPVPRRTIRALAGGFQASVMGLMIALMIRCLFWHKKRSAAAGQGGISGGYRVDGCTKAAWLAEVFMLGSERSVTAARARLTELGWLSDVDSPQWILNRYGKHEQINTDAFGPRKGAQKDQDRAVVTSDNQPQSATPRGQNPASSSTPCLNSSSSSSMNLKTRKPAPQRSGPPDGSREENWKNPRRGRGGSRRVSGPSGSSGVGPRLSNITDADLRDNDRLLELHRQAIKRGDPVAGEAGRLDFFALAERARAGGHNPPRLFAWLLKHGHFDRIATADEEAAAARIRELHYGDSSRQQGRGDQEVTGDFPGRGRPKPVQLTEDERYALCCVSVARQKGLDPFLIATQAKGWTRQQWDQAHEGYRRKCLERWDGGD